MSQRVFLHGLGAGACADAFHYQCLLPYDPGLPTPCKFFDVSDLLLSGDSVTRERCEHGNKEVEQDTSSSLISFALLLRL